LHNRTTPEALYKRRRTRSTLVITGALVLALALLLVLSHAGTALVLTRPVAEPDAVISLASHEWERLPLTIALAHQHPAARVLLTLPEHLNGKNCYECEHRVEWLVRAGVGPDRITVLPVMGSSTYGEALTARRYVDEHRSAIRRLLIVTSPYHTRRAFAVFESAFEGTGVTLGIMPATATSPARPDAWWRTPYDRWYVRYEWAAIVYYALRHGIVARLPAAAG